VPLSGGNYSSRESAIMNRDKSHDASEAPNAIATQPIPSTGRSIEAGKCNEIEDAWCAAETT
jgi:hypothetical protein